MNNFRRFIYLNTLGLARSLNRFFRVDTNILCFILHNQASVVIYTTYVVIYTIWGVVHEYSAWDKIEDEAVGICIYS